MSASFHRITAEAIFTAIMQRLPMARIALSHHEAHGGSVALSWGEGPYRSSVSVVYNEGEVLASAWTCRGGVWHQADLTLSAGQRMVVDITSYTARFTADVASAHCCDDATGAFIAAVALWGAGD